MKKKEIYDKERSALREELHNLKTCQITFLTTSITATGLILGISTALGNKMPEGVLFLFPLMVLLPSWLIFFDKATTITRIVGYYRVLEELILGHCYSDNFIGWEKALGKFREMQQADKLKVEENESTDNKKVKCRRIVNLFSKLKKYCEILALKTAHPYWILSYYTFLALSGLCLLTSTVLLQDNWYILLVAAWILFVLTFKRTIQNLWNLLEGRHTYNNNERFWRQILEVKDSAAK